MSSKLGYKLITWLLSANQKARNSIAMLQLFAIYINFSFLSSVGVFKRKYYLKTC